jgi:hypothetical protein
MIWKLKQNFLLNVESFFVYINIMREIKDLFYYNIIYKRLIISYYNRTTSTKEGKK